MEYKWYLIKGNYGCERYIHELVSSSPYFKEVFIPHHNTLSVTRHEIREPCEMYVCMDLCDESKAILNQASGLRSDDNFEVVSDDEMRLKRREFDKYKWYILRVASNYEEKVCQHVLENSMRLGVSHYFKEVFIPYEEPSEAELRSKKTVTRKKCFPGYVFLYVNLCDEVLNFVNNMPKSLKVYGFLKNGNIPKVILNEEIRSMCSALYNAQETKNLVHSYEKGEKVRINDGLFQNFTGKVDMVDDERRIVNVEVSILGKPTVIELDLAQVERVED